jgi:hypothetical protein
MTSKAISPLRARMIDDMMLRRFGARRPKATTSATSSPSRSSSVARPIRPSLKICAAIRSTRAAPACSRRP